MGGVRKQVDRQRPDRPERITTTATTARTQPHRVRDLGVDVAGHVHDPPDAATPPQGGAHFRVQACPGRVHNGDQIGRVVRILRFVKEPGHHVLRPPGDKGACRLIEAVGPRIGHRVGDGGRRNVDAQDARADLTTPRANHAGRAHAKGARATADVQDDVTWARSRPGDGRPVQQGRGRTVDLEEGGGRDAEGQARQRVSQAAAARAVACTLGGLPAPVATAVIAATKTLLSAASSALATSGGAAVGST